MNNFKNSIVCICLLLACFSAEAIKIPVFEQQKLLSTLTDGQSFTLDDGLRTTLSAPPTNWNNGFCFNTAQGRVILGVFNDGNVCPPNSFTASVTVTAEYVGTSNTVQIENFVLTVNYDASSGISYKEKDIKILTQKANFIKITMVSKTVSNNSALPFLYLRGEIEEDRQQCTMEVTQSPTFTLTKNLANQIEVNINPSLSLHAEEYDLEWTFIDKYDEATIYQTTRRFDFKDNATRVTFKETNYKISNVFEEGYVVFRVRIAGYYKELVAGKECERRVVGAWSHESSPFLMADQGLLTQNVGAYFIIDDSGAPGSMSPHEKGLNWQYAASFAEEGNRNETTSYFDGSLRQRQTVVKNENDATSIIQETIYDFEGRPAITTLPVPVKSGVLNFYENFNRNAAGLPYSAMDFDVNNANSCVASTAPMLNTSGSEKYYSILNEFASASVIPTPENYVPVANGYPFVQVEFMNDQTGRVRAQSAPGPEYTVGGVNTHETKYYYTVPAENELHRLFGSEAGDYRHYSKQTVVDANGQGSVSYLNMSGKVIATALVGNNTEDPDGTDMTEQYIAQDDDPRITDGSIILSTTITVLNEGYHKFKYEVTPQKYFAPSCVKDVNSDFCYDCIYDLQISIKNACGKEQLHGEGPDHSEPFVLINRPIGGGEADEINKCFAPTPYTFELDGKLSSYIDEMDGFLKVYLYPGSYSLSKTLTVRQSVVEDYLKDFLANQQCKTLADFERKAWDDIDKTGCEMTCEQCTQELSKSQYASKGAFVTYKETQLTNAGVDINTISDETRADWEKLYTDLKARCDNICGVPKPCEVYRGMLVADITPGGQYASFVYKEDEQHASDGTIEPVIRHNAANTVHSMNVLGEYDPNNPINPLSYKAVFTSSNDNIMINGVSVAIASLTPTQFVEQWHNHKDEWIERLLPLHPEFCELEWCEATEETRIYDENMMNIETYDEASSLGYIKTTEQMAPNGAMGANGNLMIIAPIIKYNSGIISPKDPLFDITKTLHIDPTSATFTDFWNHIMNYQTAGTVVYSLWDIPVYQTFCDETAPSTSCISTNRNNIYVCKAYRDYYWQTIRALYLSEKAKLLNELRAATQPYNTCNPVIDPEVAEKSFVSKADIDAITGDLTATQANITVQIANQCADQCEAYKPIWREALKGCNPSLQAGGVGEQILEQILNEMVEVCKRGCDAQNPLGSSTVSPANYSNTLPNSFEEVLKSKHYITTPTSSTEYPAYYAIGVCDDVLIKMPKPYGHDYDATADPEANKCACNTSLYSYDINCPCSNAAAAADVNNIINQMRTDVPEEKKCKNCIDCPTFAIYYKMYIDQYGSFNETNQAQQSMLVNFINQKTGFNLVFDDYKDHVIKCSGTDIAYPEPFAQFQRMHIDPLTTSVGLNNELPSSMQSLVNSPPPTLPYASKVVNDCTGFLETINSFMSSHPAEYLHTDIPAADINIYNWIEYHDAHTSALNELLVALDAKYGAGVFDKDKLIQQLKVCLPLDCREFEARWFKYHYPIQEGIVRRNLLLEPYNSTQLGSDVVILNNKVLLETATDSLWVFDLNPDSEQNYPWFAVVPKFTSQTVLQYTDMCRKYCCGGSLNTTSIPSEGYENFDYANITDPTRLDLMLHTLFKPVDGIPYCTKEGPMVVPAALLQQLKHTYKYPLSVTYTKQPLTNNNVLIGSITGMQAPKFDIKMETILLYSERYGTISNPNSVPGPKSSYIPVNPASDFGFEKVEDYKFISSASYNYTESQYIYKLWYRPSVTADLKIQYVLLTVPTYPFMEELIYQTSCFPQHTLCNRPLFEATVPYESECQKRLKIIANANALKNWNDYIKQVELDFRRNYLAKCIQAAGTESFQHKFTSFEHHYTLYYYDQAQNLVKTVPPAGVKLRTDFAAISAALAANTFATPDPSETHTKATVYAYNSLNQLVWQQTPDAGESRFYYDEVGRLVLSQNAKQLDAGGSKDIYSYTLYDNLSRIKEVGQLYSVGTVIWDPTQIIYPYANLVSLMGNSSNTTTTDVTKTYYDYAIPYSVGSFPYYQENTRNRVTKVATHPAGASAAQSQAVYYTYDVVGNVKQLVRQINALSTGYFDEEFKTVDYEYDIASGKVNRVVYQAGEPDQYIHVYKYDKLNRLKDVASGYRMETLDKDATYRYYQHGPLARVTLGSQGVQGIDYTYTLQGWLKGVNSGSLQAQYDMGRDGFTPTVSGQTNNNQNIARDEFGFILQYYSGDYSAAGGSTYNQFSPATAGSVLTNNLGSSNLYNGNIRMMTTAIQKLMPDGKPLAAAYGYDQLNRIKSATYYNNYNPATNDWSSSGSALTDYLNIFTYDADGNIKTQVRNGSLQKGVEMDNLTYNYIDGTNKLQSVSETVNDANYLDDIDNTGLYYDYDKIGNLIQDPSEQIANIQWNVYGKIQRITRTSESIKPDLEFEYTPDGYRSVKVVIPKTPGALRTYTYYVRDAQGNIMATYVRKYNKTIDFNSLTYTEVNSKIQSVLGQSGFASFLEGLNAIKPDLLSDVNTSIKLLSTSAKEDFLKTIDIGGILQGNHAILRSYIGNCGNRELSDALVPLTAYGSGLNQSMFLNGNNDELTNCYLNNNYPVGSPGTNMLKYMACTDPDLMEAYLRYWYVNNYSRYTEYADYLNLTSGDINQDMLDMRANFNSVIYHNALSQGPSPVYHEDLLNTSGNPYVIEAFATMLAQYYKTYLKTVSQFGTGTATAIGCFDEVCTLFGMYNICYQLDPNIAWDVLLQADAATGYQDPTLPAMTGSNSNVYLNWLKQEQAGLYFLATVISPYADYISTAQQSHAYYSASGNGIKEYLEYIKVTNGQLAYDAVVKSFFNNSTSYTDKITLTEHPIYGSSRLGMRKTKRTLALAMYRSSYTIDGVPQDNNTVTPVMYSFANMATVDTCRIIRGEKNYELSNHLGNVLVVVSDKKRWNCASGYYEADVLQANDYSPFGAPLPDRSWSPRIILNDQFNTTVEGWAGTGATLSNDNGRLKIVSTSVSSAVYKNTLKTEIGKLYEVYLDVNLGTFTGMTVIISDNDGANVNTTYTIGSAGGKHTVYFRAASNSVQVKLLPTGGSAKTGYVNFVEVKKATALTYAQHVTNGVSVTVTSRAGSPATYTAKGSIIFENGFESNANDNFETIIESGLPADSYGSEDEYDEDYRFGGAGGQEKDDEIFAGAYTAEYWEYDSRLGRRWNVDPMTGDYPWQSPYCTFDNNPIAIVDPQGLSGQDPPNQYKVEKGNTLSQIAKDNNTTVSSLLKLNPAIKDKDKIAVGQNINLPPSPANQKPMSPGEIPVDPEPTSMTKAVAPVAATIAATDGPAPVADVVALGVLAAAAAVDASQITYVTYTLKNPTTGQIYIGRTSGFGNPYDIMMRRYNSHERKAQGYMDPHLDRSKQGFPVGYNAIRGREQNLIDAYGGIGSPKIGNTINGISPANPNGWLLYKPSSLIFFGSPDPATLRR